MRTPERNDRYIMPTFTIVGVILLIANIWGPLSIWWALLYVPLLFMGHSFEYGEPLIRMMRK